MEEKPNEVFVGIPGLFVTGFPLDDAVSDAIVETLNVDPKDIEVIELYNKFYVFVKSMPVTFQEACQAVSRSSELSKTYEHNIAFLTKLIRKADKYQNELDLLVKEIESLKQENEALSQELCL